MTERLTLDGSQGEGGGQILRTALALSLATGRPFRIERIRAGREKPGLLRQHLTAVQAAVTVSGGRASGADLGSSAIDFEPGQLKGGEYRLAVGTAGSATLVLQSILPALVTAGGPTRLTLEGGTHNPFAPPFDFLSSTFLPAVRRMGARITATIEAHGFYPAGGGRFTIEIEPCDRLMPVEILDRGEVTISARAVLASLPETIGKRELRVVTERLGLRRDQSRVEYASSIGPGNVLIVEIRSSETTEIVTGFGVKGVAAEQVAHEVCDQAEAYIAAGVPIGNHLTDQLLVPMALAGGGVFLTLTPSLHTRTNADVIRQFVGVPISIEGEPGGLGWRVGVGSDARN